MSTNYCVQADLEEVAGVEAIRQLADDDSGGTVSGTPETDAVAYAINRASARIERDLLLKYTAANLALSRIVKRTAVVLSLYYLSGRRFNPKKVADEAEEMLAWLEDVRNGVQKVADIGMRVDDTGSMSNMGFASTGVPGVSPMFVMPQNAPALPARNYPASTDPLSGMPY